MYQTECILSYKNLEITDENFNSHFITVKTMKIYMTCVLPLLLATIFSSEAPISLLIV